MPKHTRIERASIESLLPNFLRDAAAKPFRYGHFDCFLFPADWCKAARGTDPASEIRSRYHDLNSGLALAGAKNLPAAFRRLLRSAGLRSTRSPVVGDIALIALADLQPRGTIVARSGYVLLGEGLGLSRVRFEGARRLAAWSIDA